ncbi:hypothetical protein [Roseomonas sp. CECT 9278]|nr:hypothetical protein [Roseomonas sp. CECT 9278]
MLDDDGATVPVDVAPAAAPGLMAWNISAATFDPAAATLSVGVTKPRIA